MRTNLLAVVALAVCGHLIAGCGAVSSATSANPRTPRTPATPAFGSVDATSHAEAAPGEARGVRSAPLEAPRPVRVPSGVTAGYVVFDRQTRKVIAHNQVHHRFRSASVVKILIALDYLERQPGRIPASDLALLKPMLRGSDDNAATALWRRGGQGKIIQRMVRKLGLTDTGPPPSAKPGFWGYTTISALDITRVYRYVLERADSRVRDVILGHLRKAQQCATDGFDQYFGIPRAVPRPWAVKQGWSGYGSVPPVKCVRAQTTSSGAAPMPAAPAEAKRPSSRAATALTSPTDMGTLSTTAAYANPVDFSRPVLHTTGMLGDRLIMVVLTLQPPGASYPSSTKRLTKLAKDIYLSVA